MSQPTDPSHVRKTNQPGHRPTQSISSFPLGPTAIQAPWRLEYIESEVNDVTPTPGAQQHNPSGSFLTDYWNAPDNDATHFVIHRTSEGMVLLNKYPYSNGHLLVALGEPKPTLMDYNTAQRAALWQLVDRAADLMQRTLQPQGINIGVNQGRAAGAGVPQHLHVHIVPRWSGDVNFITTVGHIRVLPSSLEAMYARFRKAVQSE